MYQIVAIIRKIAVMAGAVFSVAVCADDHVFPDITDYEKPFIGYLRMPAAQSQLLKAVQADGQREAANMQIDRYTVGLMRERYDNKFAYIGLFYAESGSGDESLLNGEQAKLDEQYGFVYGSGLHLSDRLEWSLFIEASNGKVTVDGFSKSDVGIGMGTELLVSPSQYLDFGLNILVSRHYNGGGLALKVNF